MYTTNYTNTFIEIADDCKAETGKVPPEKAEKSVAQMQFEMITNHPYRYTSDEVIFTVYATRNQVTETEMETKQTEFFSKGQPCLRASPLGKTYGWGIHYDHESKMALYAVGSTEYERLKNDSSLKHLKAMKSAR